MKKKKGRFSRFLNPTLIIVDLLIIIIIISVVSSAGPFLLILLSFSWIVISTFTRFYQVFRFTPEIKIFTLILIQYLFFTLSFFAIIGIFGSTELLNNKFLEVNHILSLSTIIIITVGAFKFFVYYLLLRFRVVFGGNYRKTIIIGSGDETKFLSNYFNDKKEAGFKLKKIFSDELNINTITNFILKEGIDEVYCCLTTVNPEMLNQIVNFAESNLKEVKFIPSYGKVYSKKLVYQNYDFIPILSLRTIHLEDPFNSFIKRCFDVLFSLLVIVLFLSWLTPLLAILIKIDSKGPIFFKQKRNGFNFQEFYCYKFRSMKINKQANILQATKNDFRVTKLGKVLRKFSLDELPQFFNVLIGDMSVVGPRPHMIKENEKYKTSIDKFMVRHYVRPGITGLAQTKGFRGEIETDEDIINRIKQDIFYIENWSFILDIKIILVTIFNIFRGEKKAY
tara:strand:- start:290 stop:1642 length:1353 start_codon:yes stop_codon:yes gene_type:complete